MRRLDVPGRLQESLDVAINLLNVRAVLLLGAFHLLQFSSEVFVRGEIRERMPE